VTIYPFLAADFASWDNEFKKFGNLANLGSQIDNNKNAKLVSMSILNLKKLSHLKFKDSIICIVKLFVLLQKMLNWNVEMLN
jgi:hypothetical protein